MDTDDNKKECGYDIMVNKKDKSVSYWNLHAIVFLPV